MKRLVILTLVGACVLSGCRRSGDLPPAEVLRRATLKSSQLQSADVDASLDVSLQRGGSRLSGKAVLRGVLTDAGEQAAFSLQAQGILDRGEDRSAFRWSAEVVRDGEETYLLIREALVQPPSVEPQGLDALLGAWWTLPHGGDRTVVRSLTPDPRFLRAQSAVVTVFTDRGLEDIGGRNAYHYLVSIDPDRLVALMQGLAEERGQPFSAEEVRRALEAYDARGELWIDAKTFVVHRISWTIVSNNTPPTMRLGLRMDLRKHDSAPAVTVPVESKPLDSAIFSAAILRQAQDAVLPHNPWLNP